MVKGTWKSSGVCAIAQDDNDRVSEHVPAMHGTEILSELCQDFEVPWIFSTESLMVLCSHPTSLKNVLVNDSCIDASLRMDGIPAFTL